MTKKNLYIGLIVMVFIGIMGMEYSNNKPINWSPSYTYESKIPFGCFILGEWLEENYIGKVQHIHQSPYLFLEDNTLDGGTYLLVNNAVELDEVTVEKALQWVAKGNRLMIGSHSLDKVLLDTLNLEVGFLSKNIEDIGEGAFYHQMVNPHVSGSVVAADKMSYAHYFTSIDTLKAQVISVLDNQKFEKYAKEDQLVSGIKQDFGKGEILVMTVPEAFTNYFLLDGDNKDYTSGWLSYLKNGYSDTLYLDNYLKAGKRAYASPMHLFLSNRSLKWAYYLVLIGSVLFVFFEGKRKQRVIPVVNRLKNQTLEYAQLIADMYFHKGDSTRIAKQVVDGFWEYVRSHFYIITNNRNADFVQRLADKSNHTFDETENLIKYLEKLKTSRMISSEELIQLNQRIEKFKTKAHGR